MTPRTLIVGLGNPSPYLWTLHNAGQHALMGAQPLLGKAQPSFAHTRIAKKKVNASLGPEYQLIWSPVLMNISGKYLSQAYRELLENSETDAEGKKTPLNLLIVHDDLEEDLGVVKLRRWGSSHRGHNGVKSVNTYLKPTSYPEARFGRISVGVGRPKERDAQTVSDYVLKEMDREKLEELRKVGGEGVRHCLYEWDVCLSEGKRMDKFKNEGATPEARSGHTNMFGTWRKLKSELSGNSLKSSEASSKSSGSSTDSKSEA